MPAPVRAFFDYQASVMEPWDGPAFVVFTDGRVVGAALDRNGLRPARYLVTTDGLVLVASEAGVLDVDEERVLSRGRLGPGGLIAVDLGAGRFLDRERRAPRPRRAPALRRAGWPGAGSRWPTCARRAPTRAWTAPGARAFPRCARTATRARSCSSSSAPCTSTGRSRSDRWATTRRWPCSRPGRASSSPTSSSGSRR